MYLVERYEPGSASERGSVPESAGAGGAPEGSEDGRVREVRQVLSALIPGDEIRLSLFEAPSLAELERALAAGGTTFIRIVEALVDVAEPTGVDEPGPVEVGRQEREP